MQQLFVQAVTFTVPMEELSKTGNIKWGPGILLQGAPSHTDTPYAMTLSQDLIFFSSEIWLLVLEGDYIKLKALVKIYFNSPKVKSHFT